MNHNCFTILLCLALSPCLVWGKAKESHVWVGKNLEEVYCIDTTWYYHNTKNDAQQLHVCDTGIFRTVDFFGKRKHLVRVPFRKLAVTEDTLYLEKHMTTHLFVRQSKVNFPFRFYGFEYTVLNMFASPIERYSINYHGVLRKSDATNRTLIEKEIDKQTLDTLKRLCRTIDIRNMDKAYGRRNDCDNHEQQLRFIDSNGREYTYTAIHLRQQLIPFVAFIKELAGEE